MKRIKHLLKIFFIGIVFLLVSNQAKSQCIQLLDQEGDTSSNPTYVNCLVGPAPANVTLSFINVNALTTSTIDWGDGSVPENFPAGIAAGALLSHLYPSAIDTYLITITQTSPACTMFAHFVNERSVIAQIAPLTGSVTTICAPNVIQFVNKSTNVSVTTEFTLDFGDGSPVLTLDHTNVDDTISHTYQRNTVDCNTIVTLTARNRCTGSIVSTNTYGPIQVYDLDSAIINADKQLLCYPDTTVTFTNNTDRNCLADGNTQQRLERWIIRDSNGNGIDSTGWTPWPPSVPRIISFPGSPRPITYTVILLDSSFCGVDSASRTITITDPPLASFSSLDTICGGTAMTFTNGSTPGMAYSWNFDEPSSGANNTSTQTNPSHTFTNTEDTILSFNVRLIVTNPLGFLCRDTFIKTVYVLPQPTSDFSMNTVSGNISGCDSLLVEFADLSHNAIEWSWDFNNDGMEDFNGQNPPIQKFLVTSTVRLSVTSSNGCVHNRTRVINIFRTPDADFTVNSVCVNQAASFTDASQQYPGNNIIGRTWNFDDPASGANNTSTQTNPTHTFTNPGIYNVRLIIHSANACPDTMIKQLTVQFPPSPNFNPSVNSGCSPLTVTFNNTSANADPALYSWKKSNTEFSTDISPSVTYINNGTTNDTITIKLIAQTTFGCKDSITKTVVVFPNPIAGISANTLPSCNPSPINFLSTSTGASSFEWDFDDGSSSTLPNPSHQFENNTNSIRVYNVRLIARNINLCADTAEIPVLVYPNQTFVINTDVDSGCTPLTVSFPSFPGIVSYQWDFGDAQSSSDANPRHTYLNLTGSPINYECRAILTDAFGCRDTIFKTIRVKPVPTALFTADNAFGCSPDTIVFSNISSNANSYIWYFGDGDSLVTNNNVDVEHAYENNTTAPMVFQVRLLAFNDDSCFREHTENVTIYPKVVSSFTIDTVQCSPYVALADNRSLNGNKFYWYVNNSLVDSVQNKQFAFSNISDVDEIYEIKLRCISIFGCLSDTVVNVRVLPQPNANFITDVNAGCEPLAINFTNQSTNNINYSWDFGDGETSSTSDINFVKTYTNTGRVPIERTIQLSVSNSFGCVDTIRRNITIFPNVEASFTLSDTVLCSPMKVQVFNTSQNTLNYIWFVDNVLVDTNANPIITITNSGASDRHSTIRLLATSAYGCSEEFSLNVRILPRPKADFFIPSPVIKYPLNTFSFVNQNIQAGFSYKWYFGDGDSSLVASPAPHSYAIPGTYQVMLIVSNSECSDTLVRTAKIEPPTPVVSFTGSGEGCSPLTVTFENNTLYADRYEWDFGDGIKSNEENPTHVYREGGLYTISLIAYGEGGQALDVHVDSVYVYANPNAYFISQPKVVFIPSDPIVFFNLSQNATQFFWDFGDGFTSTEPSPTHYYLESGEYNITLVAQNEFGCRDTFMIEKAVKAESGGNVQVPNAFTPNPNGGNGGVVVKGEYNNDVFYPVIEGAENYKLNIYNRWGEMLFESNDINIGWDGYYRGELCKQDVYVWKVELFFSDGTKKIKTGDLLLLK